MAINPFKWFHGLFAKKRVNVSPPSEKQTSHSETNITQTFSPDILDIIEKLVLITPDLSQALRKMILIGNNGYQVELDMPNSNKANDEIKRFSQNILKYSAGMDGLINQIFNQVIVKGAISVEIVPSMSLDRIENIIFVPVKSIRFRKENGFYYPQQTLPGKEPIDLNPEQYIYTPIQTFENSPYGIPLFLSALKTVGIQTDGMDNIKHLIQKFGLLGFINAQKKVPLNSDMSPTEYKKYLKDELNSFASSFRQNFRSGVAVSYDDVQINHHQIATDNKGLTDLFQIIEQQIASGIDIDPALLGRTYSTTETYAGVVYHTFLSSLENIRRMVKRTVEKILFSHLTLSGYPVKNVNVRFHKSRALNPKEEAEAKKTEIENVLLKMNSGLIDEDTAARELGYEKASGNTTSGCAASSKTGHLPLQNKVGK